MCRLLADPFRTSDWEKLFNDLYPKIRCRWFISLKDIIEDANTVKDIFGIRELKFSSSILSTVEQEELIDFIGEYRLYKKDKDKQFHPGYKINLWDNNFEKRKNFIAEYLAKNFQIPLWELFKGDDGIHKLVLDRIATNRATFLTADAIDSWPKENKKLSTEDVDNLKLKYMQLGFKWAADVGNWMLNLVNNSEIPSIQLTEKELPRAVGIFEALNLGGTPLSVFDLVVAKSARDLKEKSLSQMILNRLSASVCVKNYSSAKTCLTDMAKLKKIKKFEWTPASMFSAAREGSLTTRTQNQFLNILSILVQSDAGVGKIRNVHIIDVDTFKKERILSLSTSQISNGVESAVDALSRAMAFLQFRCGVVSFEDLPYQLMILPISLILSDIKSASNKEVLNKLEYWFWVSIFAGRYREKQNEICANDLKSLYVWCTGKDKENPFIDFENTRLFNVQDYCDKESLIPAEGEKLEARNAIKFGILSLILANEAEDFLETEKLSAWRMAARESTDVSYEVHHVVPLKNVTSLLESSKEIRKDSGNILNSPLNLTYIKGDTNRKISALSPSEYTKKVQEKSLVTHYLPTSFQQQVGETDAIYQRRILEERLTLIKTALLQKLHSLLK
jgi:hypothetical protein